MHPLRIKEDSIREAEVATRLRELHRTAELNGEYTEFERSTMELQKVYLNAFEKTFSTVMARRIACVTAVQVNGWKKTWYSFAIAFNQIIEDHAELLVGSAFQRAMGSYTKVPDGAAETESGFIEDGAGNPINVGGNDKLAIKLLEGLYPSTFGNKKTVVVSNVKPFVVKLTDDTDEEEIEHAENEASETNEE